MGLKNLKSKSKAAEKAERKFEKKVEFYSKVKVLALAATEAPKKISKNSKARRWAKKLKAYDLTALSEVLPEFQEKQAEKRAPKLKNKLRQKLAVEEGERLKEVLNHEAFKSDPFGSIYQHLQSTQPAAEEVPVKKRSVDDKKKIKKKKKKSKSSSQMMEI